MKYWTDMTDKFGFGDGDAEPPDAQLCREVYVRVVNALAEREGSSVRVAKFDRPGMHNGCMVWFVAASDNQSLRGELDVDPDAAMLRAIGIAEGMGLDDLVSHACSVDGKDLASVLVDIEDSPPVGPEVASAGGKG